MFRKSLLVLLLTSMLLLMNCVEYLFSYETVIGSGNIIKLEKSISNFKRVDVSHAFDINISYGSKYKVELIINDNIEKYVLIEKRGNILNIGLKQGIRCKNTNLEVEITMPDIYSVSGSGASNISVEDFNFDHAFEISLSGASEFDGFMKTGDLYIDLSGASELECTGAGNDLEIDGSGACEIDLGNFKINNADIDLSGASEVVINVSGVLNVDLSGASEILYYGNPKMGSISTSGASNIKHRK